MSTLFIRLYYKEVRMSDPKNGNSGSEDRRKSIVESDQGGNNRSTGRGRVSAPNRPAPPKPEYNPNK